MDTTEKNSISETWRKTARSRLRFELSGLSFALQKGFSSEGYAQHLWSKGSKRWIGTTKPTATEYLLKEAESFREFYPEVSFEVVEAGEEKAELVFTDGCLGGWGQDQWAIARNRGLSQKDICAYCQEAFQSWARPLGIHVDIGPGEDGHCRLRVARP